MTTTTIKNFCPQSQFISKLHWNENGTMTMWIGRNVYLVENIDKKTADDWASDGTGCGRYFIKNIKPNRKVHRVS